MTYVVVGAGPAGVVAAETLKQKAPSKEVLMIGESRGRICESGKTTTIRRELGICKAL